MDQRLIFDCSCAVRVCDRVDLCGFVSNALQRPITLWLPDGRAIGCVFVTAQQLSSLDLVQLRVLITREFRDSGSESHIGPALCDDLVSSRYTFLSSGAPITKKQEDTLTPLDFGATLTIRPRSFANTFGGSSTRSAGPGIRRLKSATGYEESFLSSIDKKSSSDGGGGGVGGAEHDALSTAVMPSPSLHAISAPLPPPPPITV